LIDDSATRRLDPSDENTGRPGEYPPGLGIRSLRTAVPSSCATDSCTFEPAGVAIELTNTICPDASEAADDLGPIRHTRHTISNAHTTP
jgi:hypothetical protein